MDALGPACGLLWMAANRPIPLVGWLVRQCHTDHGSAIRSTLLIEAAFRDERMICLGHSLRSVRQCCQGLCPRHGRGEGM